MWTSVVVVHGCQNSGPVVVPHRLSCSAACGIFLDQGLNPRLLHWQMDSLPPSRQGSPIACFLKSISLRLYFPLAALWLTLNLRGTWVLGALLFSPSQTPRVLWHLNVTVYIRCFYSICNIAGIHYCLCLRLLPSLCIRGRFARKEGVFHEWAGGSI